MLLAPLRDKLIDLGKPEQLAAQALGREVDLGVDKGDDGTIPEVWDWPERYPLDDALLAPSDDAVVGWTSITSAS